MAVSGINLSDWSVGVSTLSWTLLPHLALLLTELWSKKAMREAVTMRKRPGLCPPDLPLGKWIPDRRDAAPSL